MRNKNELEKQIISLLIKAHLSLFETQSEENR